MLHAVEIGLQGVAMQGDPALNQTPGSRRKLATHHVRIREADQRLEIAVLHVHGRRRVIAEIHAHRQPIEIEMIGIRRRPFPSLR
jgi:hypothetical protein